MATTPTAPFQSLPLIQQVNLVETAYLSYYGVSLPVTTVLAKDKLPAIAAEVTQELNGIKALYSMTGNDRTATVQGLDAFVKYVPELAGATITVGTLLDVFTGVQSNLNSLVKNPLVVPSTPVVVSPVITPTPKPPAVVPPVPVVTPPVTPTIPTPAPVVSSQSNNTLSTVLGVGAAALGAIALVKAVTPQTAPAAVPAASVIAPPIVTSPAPPAEQPASGQTTPPDSNEIAAAQVVPLVNEGNAGEAEAAANVDIIKSIDDTGLDEAIAEQERIQSFEPAPTDEELQAAQDAVDQTIQDQQTILTEEASNRAFESGYNTIEDMQAAEDQQVLEQMGADQIAADAQVANEAESELLRESRRGLTSEKAVTQATANAQDVSNFAAKEDWRVRLSLSPGANYLYKAKGAEGILLPLVATDGVIFPYTPNIVVTYAAHYEPTTLTHSNYKIFQYGSSSVDSVSITGEFTAQDTEEANYLLAVIHFFRSVTKMFYGNDSDPLNGTPPPLCYLSGLGEYQFDAHPLAITSFNYTLPTDVDYVRAGVGSATSPAKPNNLSASTARLGPNLTPGGLSSPPAFSSSTPYTKPTYVPTKMQIAITAYPVVTRNDISNNFSLKKYATGELLQGTKRKGGGIW